MLQRLRRERLDVVQVEAGFLGALPVGFLAVAGEGGEDSAGELRLLAKVAGNFVAVHAGEADVEQDQLGEEVFAQVERD